MTFERRDVTFSSGDSFVVGWFYMPEGDFASAGVPAVALAPGTGGVKELYHESFAEAFAEAGIAALLFDYRSFGASGGGRPRPAPPPGASSGAPDAPPAAPPHRTLATAVPAVPCAAH